MKLWRIWSKARRHNIWIRAFIALGTPCTVALALCLSLSRWVCKTNTLLTPLAHLSAELGPHLPYFRYQLFEKYTDTRTIHRTKPQWLLNLRKNPDPRRSLR